MARHRVNGPFALPVRDILHRSGEMREFEIDVPAPAKWGEGLVAVEPNGWKARHIGASGRVPVTVPVHRAGVLALLAQIPPATISFHGEAFVHPAGTMQTRKLLERLDSLLPRERRGSAAVIEIVPEGEFVTYGVGVPLRQMRDTSRARARVPVR